MGNICCDRCDSGGLGADASILRDLPAPSITGLNDKYSIWEHGTPFKITSFQAFKNAINAAEAAESGDGYVTLESLAEELNTKAWSPLKKSDSKLARILLSDAFKDKTKGQREGQIDKDILMIYGLMHCQDHRKMTNKANAFYEILQEGGFERHHFISATDKDLKPAFKKLCSLITVELFDFCPVKVSYSTQERR